MRGRFFLQLFTLFPITSLTAQGTPDSSVTDTTVHQLEAIEVTGARTHVILGGSSAVVLHLDSLHVPPAPSLEQALRELPFVHIRQNSRGETELALRGSESRQMAVMLDGIPLTLGYDHRTDPSVVPLTGAQRLVLVRGLSSLLHGPNVLGGVVEVDLARGAPSNTPQRELSVGTGVDEYGAHVVSAAGTAPVTWGSNTFTFRGGVGYRSRDGIPLSDDAIDPAARDGIRTNSDLDHLDGFAAMRWQNETGRYIGFTATGYRVERGVPPELHVQEPRLWRYPSISRGLGILSAGTGAVTTPLGFGSLDVAAGFNAGSMEIESFDSPAYQTVVGRERGEERTVSGRLHARHSLMGYGELRLALTGAEVRYDETLNEAASERYRQRLWSSGVEAQWPVLGDALVGGGLVYDAATTPETGGKPALGRLSSVGWRLGATTSGLADGLSFHVSVSRRARFPSLRELYSGALNRFEPNPNLRPERLLGAEVGTTLIRGLGSGALNIQAVTFHHRLADAVVRTTTIEGLFRRENRDEMRSTGFELLAGWSSASGVSFMGDLLVQRVRLHDNTVDPRERRPEHQPEVRGRFGVGVPLLQGINMMTDMRYIGRQYCVHPDLGGEMVLEGQAEGDVALEKTWALKGGIAGGLLSSLRTTVALDNVTDATVYDQCGLPRPGRTLRFAIQLR
jgi:iron complex outermembrane receptor protein